jgi:MFS family permease
LYRWMIFSILSLMFIFSYFMRLSTGVLGPELMRDLEMDAAQLGLLGGIFFYAFAAVQIPVGLALDFFKPKRVIVITTLFAALGCFLLSEARSFTAALYGRMLIGLGTSAVLMGSLKILSDWFRPNEFGFLSGFMLSLGNLGALIATTPLVLMSAEIGWRKCFFSFGLLAILFMSMIALFVSDASAGERTKRSGLSRREKLSKAILNPLALVFSNKHFWFIALSSLVRYGALVSIQGFLGTLFLLDILGYSTQTSANILSMISIGYMIGSPLAGRLSDRVFLSRKKVMVVGLLLFAVTVLPFLLIQTRNTLLWYVIYWGLGFFASVGAVSFAHVKELFPKEVSGLALTAINLFNIGGVGIGQQFLGIVIRRFPKTSAGYPIEAYQQAFAILFVASLAAFMVYLATKDTSPLSLPETDINKGNNGELKDYR